MKKDARVYLEDILESIRYIQADTAHMSEADFFENRTVQDAAFRRLTVIGEAAKRVPDAAKEKYSKIPWKEIAGMRDVLIHEYAGVNLIRVWNTIKRDLPKLKPNIQAMLEEIS